MSKKNYSNRQRSIFFDLDDEEPEAPIVEQPKAPVKPLNSDDSLRFISFGSGSSGNCAYLGTSQRGILIDAGVDPEKVFDDLARNGIAPTCVKGVILTHDHRDHVGSVYKIVRAYHHIGVYCTPKLLEGMLRRHNLSRRVRDNHVAIHLEIPFSLADMQITAFGTSHDGTDNMGFCITYQGKHFVVATDMGTITSRAEFYMSQANYLMIESDYNIDMLRASSYPEMLKDRVMGAKGHLENLVAGRFVADHYHPGLHNIFLCHISEETNTPELALTAFRDALKPLGISIGDGSNAPDQRDRDVQLYALPRYDASPLFWLD